MPNLIKKLYGTYLLWLGILLWTPTLLFAQKELKGYDRAVYAGVGYAKLGFGEVNRELLTEKQVQKLSRRIHRIQTDYGAVIVFASLISEEVKDWESGNLRGFPKYYLGEDPRADRNHVTILFSEVDGKNWIFYGRDNGPDFTAHTKKLQQQFTSSYHKQNAYRPIRRLLKNIDHIYDRLDTERKNALLYPQLSATEWIKLAQAEMAIAGDYNSAVNHLKNALKLDTANAEAYMLIGYAYLELQNWDATAAAFAHSWSLAKDFETAIGILTLHTLRNESVEVKKWTERIRQFSSDFEKRIYEAAHYGNKGSFLGNTTREVFNEQFQQEILKCKSKKMPEASVLPH